MKLGISILICAATSLVANPWVEAAIQKSPAPKPAPLVVIDPGHGGSDSGTVFQHRLAEKHVTLWLARDVSAALEKQGVRVVLTRNSDRDVALTERTAMANRLRARVFLSLHLNSSEVPTHPSERLSGQPNGFETFILNTATAASSHRLAHLENSVLQGSVADVQPSHGSLESNMGVNLIIKEHLLDSNLSESKRLACSVQNRLVRSFGGTNRGVKQALFYVLLGADMPSILVEAGFLSHRQDRARLLNPTYRRRMGRTIAQAIVAFLNTENVSKNPSQIHAEPVICKVF